MKKAWVLCYPLSAQQILWSDWADAQADLSLHWAQSHFVGFDMRWLIYQLLQWIVGYCKNPKNSDTRKVCGNHHKIQTRWLYRKVMHPKDAAGMVNSVDPDVGAVWSGSTLFAQAYLSANFDLMTVTDDIAEVIPYYFLNWAASWQNQQNGMCAQRRLRSAWTSAQFDQSSLSAWRKLESWTTLWVHSEDSDQTGRMPRVIWVFAGRTVILLVLSWGGSNYYHMPSFSVGERGGSVVECRTPEREVRGSKPTAAVLCPWARHFTPRKYWLITQEAMALSRHDWKIVDWDVKPQHNQPNPFLFHWDKKQSSNTLHVKMVYLLKSWS